MATGLSMTDSGRITVHMRRLFVAAEARLVLLADSAGNVLVHVPDSPASNLQTLAVLGAGSFCATRELAAMAGESTFRSVFHQGENTSIYMHSVATNYLVMVLFGPDTTVGLVKLYLERVSRQLAPLLLRVAQQTSASAAGADDVFELRDVANVFGS